MGYDIQSYRFLPSHLHCAAIDFPIIPRHAVAAFHPRIGALADRLYYILIMSRNDGSMENSSRVVASNANRHGASPVNRHRVRKKEEIPRVMKDADVIFNPLFAARNDAPNLDFSK